MKAFLDYIPGNSLLHRLNPLSKIAVSIAVCAACFISSSPLVLCTLIIIDLLLAALGHIVPFALRLLKGLISLSVFLFILQVLFIRTGTPLFNLFPGFPVTTDGLVNATRLVLRLTGAMLPLAVMISLTKLNDLSGVLTWYLHIPYKYAFMLITAIRFIPVFATEMEYIIQAQTSRGIEFDTKNIFKKIKLIIPLCIPLLITSVGKSDTTAVSAEMRGFERRTRSSMSVVCPVKAADIAAIILSIGLVAVTAVIRTVADL
ncbi:MAG: energy-coupling factor transporter transmembrane protein EcfT [Treponema sp.]|nr:energy-coupling factor transporter transmembrane protein EcfT [Treponema sp.]